MISPQYFVIDGIDGCGKTTQAYLLHHFIVNELKQRCILTREPGSPFTMLNVRNFVLSNKKVSPQALELLFCADRAEHTEIIKQKLDEGIWVVSDRSFISGFAYGMACGHSYEELKELARFSIQRYPDKVIYLETSLKTAMARRENRAEKTREESKGDEFMRDVIRGFELMRDSSNFKWLISSISSDNRISEVHDEIVNALDLWGKHEKFSKSS